LIEVLTAAMIAAMVMTMSVAVFRPAVTVADAERVNTTLVQSMDSALYRVQRDIRQSDPNGIFVCSGATPPTSCILASSLTSATHTQYFAILTARDGGSGEMNWDSSGRPAWTGFQIYWLDASASNASQLLRYAFAPATIQPGIDPVILNADVVTAVGSAMSSPSADTVAQNIDDIQTWVNVTQDSVGVRLGSAAANGTAADTTTVQSDTYARN
jgi:type II secretory pathway component PulJ